MSEQVCVGDGHPSGSPEGERNKAPSRIVLSENELANLSPSELVDRWKQQDTYVTSVEEKLGQQEGRYSIHTYVEYFDYIYDYT